MCGIVGYIGSKNAVPLIMDGLRRLEYRGYDSAGVAVIHDHQILIRRDVGKLNNLTEQLLQNPMIGRTGIGHTRWATHGAPSEINAHPHISMNGDFVIVHNGIVENYLQLRQMLSLKGFVFKSETDSEIIAHLIEHYANTNPQADFIEISRQAINCLQGAQAIVIMRRCNPERLIAVRVGNAGGVAVGIGENEMYIASDIPAILDYTRRMIFLESHQMAIISANDYRVMTLEGEFVDTEQHHITWDSESTAKDEFDHYMQKEIFEQPIAITSTLSGRIDFDNNLIRLPDLKLTAEQVQSLQRVVIVACGTSYYSGLVGKFFIEKIARLSVEVDYGSEYRYRDPLIDGKTAILAITQSGETVDTLSAMEEARAKGGLLWSIVNAYGSQAMRLADGFITMNAGAEIGVASTKAFTTSVVCQYLLAVYLGQLRGTITPEQTQALIHQVVQLPDMIGQVLACDGQIQAIAEKLYHYNGFLFVGRGMNYPIALEGALKLKEISYIHAEGYPAGEMKHGPIALLDEHMPVVAIAPKDALYEKMISQIEQAKARGAVVVAIASEGDTSIQTKADYVMTIPNVNSLLNPILAVVPLQLLAYHIAVLRGADVDQPRNLAKSVTVE
jgi:glucosamine--fructose-6-phosphate aminotransferase (isomerizing)